MAIIKARTEFALALNQVSHDRGLEPEIVIQTIKEAVLAAYRKDYGVQEGKEYEVKIDAKTGETKLFCWTEGEKKEKEEITPPGFGRIAAQVAKQVILQKIREAEKSAIMEVYKDRVGSLVSGAILRFDRNSVVADIGKAQGIMPPEEKARGEHYKIGQRLTFLIKEVRETNHGKKVIISRADEDLVKELFRREVPEVASGAVKIKEVAREAGIRSKVAVFSTQGGVDPVGSCVGQKGVRVQAVIKALSGEKIDIIPFSEDPEEFVAAALSPAEEAIITIDEGKKVAAVKIPEDQLSLAIGKDGQNVRLAAKLTGYKIDIQGAEKLVKKETQKSVSSLEELGLSSRVVTALTKSGITEAKKLKQFSPEELREIKGIGPKAVQEIKKAIK